MTGASAGRPAKTEFRSAFAGRRTDEETFVVDYDTVGCIDGFTVTSRFSGNAIAKSFADRESGFVLPVPGTVESGN